MNRTLTGATIAIALFGSLTNAPSVSSFAAEGLPVPKVRQIGGDDDYGFTDWKVGDADWQKVRDYYASPQRGSERMTVEGIDPWRPFANPVDRQEDSC